MKKSSTTGEIERGAHWILRYSDEHPPVSPFFKGNFQYPYLLINLRNLKCCEESFLPHLPPDIHSIPHQAIP